ncbi:hypothetical protein [Nocardioides yefusunii]|uniref:DUF559 domain-containing protein n=1 Tax=Nocardioides yefusunii TaxID=2500546 RepID=A0ABW1QYM1_9ACTN|nr:hypothetical protein [Nocardioides yefusunii]
MDVHLTRSGEHPPHLTRPVTRGAHLSPDGTRVAELTAWAAVLPDHSGFTHVTGAELLGLWLPPLPAPAPVTAQVPTGAPAPRRPGLRLIRASDGTGTSRVHGLPVAPVTEVLLSLCRDLGPLDALVALDSALHLRLCTLAELEHATRRRRRGAPLLRLLTPLADARSESPWETILREFHRAVEAPAVPQHEILDASGSFVARADLWLAGTRVIHEYDGAHHLSVEGQRADLRRDRRLGHAGWIRRGYTSDDLLHRPHEILRDVDAALGRPSHPHLLTRWHDLLSDSARTPAGRALLTHRLRQSTQRPSRAANPTPLWLQLLD